MVQRFAIPELRPSPQTGLRGTAIALAAILTMLVDGTAANIINSGLPYLQGIAKATPDEASWIVTLFNAAYYSTVLFSPWLYARFSRKPLLLTGLVSFALTSFMLSAAQSLGVVLVLRFIQGVSLGCVFVPAGALLFTSLPLKLLPYAPPFFAAIVLGSGTMGTLIGGYLSETYGGPAIYLPGAFATLVCASLLLIAAPNPDKPQPGLRADVVGFALTLAAFGALQYLANEGERRNWLDDPSIFAASVVLVVAVLGFVVWELYLTTTPLVNLRLLVQKRNLGVGSLINLVLGVVGYSVVSFVLYLETVASATATIAGAVVLLRLTTYLVGIIMAFALVRSHVVGVRTVIAVAAVGSAFGFLAFAQDMTTTAHAATFVAGSLVFGLFFSMLSQPVPALVLGTLGVADMPAGLALYKLSAPIGLSIGTAIFQTLLDHRVAEHAAALASYITPARLPVASFLGSGGKIGVLSRLVQGQAQALAFEDVMGIFALCVLLAIPLVFLAKVESSPAR